MRLIGLAVVFALGLVLAPLAVEAQQQAEKVYRVGWIVPSPTALPHLQAAFRLGLSERGYVEGKNLIFERRYHEGQLQRYPELMTDLVRLQVDTIFVSGDQGIKAAKDATTTIPIVMVACDAVATGFISSLARPGGNITGVSCMYSDIAAKRLELLGQMLPKARRIALLYNPDDPGRVRQMQATETAARALGMTVQVSGLRNEADFEGAFQTIGRERAEALIVLGEPLTMTYRARVIEFANHSRTPAMYTAREFVDSGGLLSYGPSLTEMNRLAGGYVAKILNGVKPADLPVEQPTKFELAINLRTAKALGLTIPQLVLGRADEIIQ
jgi:putative tryptophan/tyrosine transport system substrate-binding protein